MKKWAKPEIKAEMKTRNSVVSIVRGYIAAWKNGCISM